MGDCTHESMTAFVKFIDFKPRSLDEVVKTTDVVCDECRCWRYTVNVRLDGTSFTERADP